ncbi:MAG: SRPBCC family protein [Bacteroidia bacterium]
MTYLQSILAFSLLAFGFSFFAQSVQAQERMSKKYITIVAERVIKAPAAKVWETMVLDYGRISNFSPFIYTSDYQNGSLQGEVGAERKCHFNESGSRFAHEKILSIDQTNMVMQNAVIEAGKLPMDTDNSQAFYKVRDNGDGTCTASYEFQFRAKPAFMTSLMRGSFQKQLDETLMGLEHYITTGEVVNAQSGNWKMLRAQYE